MKFLQNLYGLVLCGGRSSRMGEDKSFLNYHGSAQCYYVYRMLQTICTDVFISCNSRQAIVIDPTFKAIEDDRKYAERGPATGVLTAFSIHPEKNFLVIGCDYPLLTNAELRHFVQSIPEGEKAAAFYDRQAGYYLPVVAFYSSAAGQLLLDSAGDSKFSLKQLLEFTNAYRHFPLNADSLRSVDTKDEREEVMRLANDNH